MKFTGTVFPCAGFFTSILTYSLYLLIFRRKACPISHESSECEIQYITFCINNLSKQCFPSFIFIKRGANMLLGNSFPINKQNTIIFEIKNWERKKQIEKTNWNRYFTMAYDLTFWCWREAKNDLRIYTGPQNWRTTQNIP